MHEFAMRYDHSFTLSNEQNVQKMKGFVGVRRVSYGKNTLSAAHPETGVQDDPSTGGVSVSPIFKI
jgi:hypothetical protein